MESEILAVNVTKILSALFIEQKKSIEKKLNDIEKIVRNKFNQSDNTSIILSYFLGEPEKYQYIFKETLIKEFEKDDAFKNQVEQKVILHPEDILDKIPVKYTEYVEWGLKGPQGNRMSFIPMGELVICPRRDCGYKVNLRTKGQRCPHHNEELVPFMDYFDYECVENSS